VDSAPDACVIDLQHGLFTRPTLEAAIGIVRQMTVPLARTADDSPTAISTALDAGAMGIIVPMVESAEQAARVVMAAKYPPEGKRSSGGIRPIMDAKVAVPLTNQAVMVGVMIETAIGVENAAAIASVPGIDMVLIGPFDLSLSLGTFPEFGPRHEDAVQRIKREVTAAGKVCGIFTPHWTMAADRRRQGFGFVSLCYDQDLVQTAAKANVKRFAIAEGKNLLKGAIALVTGCSRGIGPRIAKRLLAAGAGKVYCAARDLGIAKVVASDAPEQLVPLALDTTNGAQIAAAAERCLDVTLLVNNAGVNFNTPLFAIDSAANARQEMEVNYFGTLAMCRAFQPILKANGGGAIVNMLSVLSHMNLPMMGSLCASKAALLSLTQALRAEVRGQGTHVMGVLPGAVDTDMTRDFKGPKISPEVVAEAIVHGLSIHAEEIYPGDMATGVAYGLAGDPKALERAFAEFLPERRL
jgi:2-keto-3-deoxy-L-rhamnonate aldolase RhmA/NAD(P)-dependent dehydrogenase (short-subunit alcohol dehydrogenase family)